MYTIPFLILIIIIVLVVATIRKRKAKLPLAVPVDLKTILISEVSFYQNLDEQDKVKFEERAALFLSKVRITGVRTVVENTDKVLIAASAIIPIFNFSDWEYRNLNEVLLYPDSFDHDFEQEGEGRNILGMVGSGALNHVMILSQSELRQAFLNKTAKDNTAIHEFVHLLDKTDGEIDGMPESLLDKQYIIPWLKLMQRKIQEIKNNDSDINPYGASNEAEFLAVVSTYFFERPSLFQEKHPELYAMLLKMYGPPQLIDQDIH